jgi:hypothetical protein
MKLPIFTRICLNEYDMETGNNQAGNLVLDKDGRVIAILDSLSYSMLEWHY